MSSDNVFGNFLTVSKGGTMNEKHSTTSALNKTELPAVNTIERDNLVCGLIEDLMLLPHAERHLVISMVQLIDSLDDEGIIDYTGGNSNTEPPTDRMRRISEYIDRLMAFTRTEREEAYEVILMYEDDLANSILVN